MYASFKNLLTYDEQSKVLLVREPIFHTVWVSERGCHLERFGYNVLALDLNEKGDFAVLRGHKGKVRVTIKPSKVEYDRVLVGNRKKTKTIRIGELSNNGTAGKDELLQYLAAHPQGHDSNGDKSEDIALSFLRTILFRIAKEQGITDELPDTIAEDKALRSRSDFAFGKDFSDLYEVGDLLPVD